MGLVKSLAAWFENSYAALYQPSHYRCASCGCRFETPEAACAECGGELEFDESRVVVGDHWGPM